MNNFKIGDLIKWTDYRDSAVNPTEYIGLVIKRLHRPFTGRGFHDLVVLCEGKEVCWTSWQCEVISE